MFLSAIAYYIYTSSDLYTFDCSGWNSISNLFYATIVLILNFILMFISLLFRFVFKDKKEYKDRSVKFIGLKHFLLISVICYFVIFIHFAIRLYEKTTIDNEVIKITLDYLKDRYGSEEFDVIEVDREFSDSGWIETDNLQYYDVEVIHKKTNIEFNVELDVDSNRNILEDSIGDWFLFKRYYGTYKAGDFKDNFDIKFNLFVDYLKSKNLNLEVSASSYFNNGGAEENFVPSGYGKIPNKEEFFDLIIDYQLKNEIEIKIDENELLGNDIEKELKDYLYILAEHIISYYGDLEYFSFVCEYSYGNNRFWGDLIINNNYIVLEFNEFEDRKERK